MRFIHQEIYYKPNSCVSNGFADMIGFGSDKKNIQIHNTDYYRYKENFKKLDTVNNKFIYPAGYLSWILGRIL